MAPHSLTLMVALLSLSHDRQALQNPEDSVIRYVVAVHPKIKARPDPEYRRNLIASLYLKRATSWRNGDPARPYGRLPNSEAQRLFEKQVLRASPAQIARHWLKMKSSRGFSPPKSVRSDRLMTKYLKRYPGAFGILPEHKAKKAGLKVFLIL